MIAFVLLFINDLILLGQIPKFSSSTSQKTGFAPAIITAFVVAIKVKFGTITSSSSNFKRF